MPSVTLDVSGTFPDGTALGAYDAVSQPAENSVPIGTPVATGTVTDGSVTFSDLTEDATYIATGLVGSTYPRYGFTVNTLPAGLYHDGIEIATQAGLDAEISARAAADATTNA